MAYDRGETDEFVHATAIAPAGSTPVRMEDGDAVIFMNNRSARARQITRAFIENEFDGFPRAVRPQLSAFVTLTEYNEEFHLPVAFPPERLRNTFGEYIAQLGLPQLRIVVSEKFDVSYFYLTLPTSD